MARTDNKYLADKVALRLNHLPEGKVRVLDCYAGRGIVWSAVRSLTDQPIEVLGIDVRRREGFMFEGDNLAYLKQLDLSRFEVVDLDAYGVPYQQLALLFERGYAGTIFVTFIQSQFGELSHGLLLDLGYTQAMIEKCPALLNRQGWTKFKRWLAIRGVPFIWHRSRGQTHHYVAINCAEVRAAGCDTPPGGTVADRA